MCSQPHFSPYKEIHSPSTIWFRERKAYSTAQLLSTLETIGKNLEKGLQTDVVFMDISKAFDTVDHKRLLQKLREVGVSGSLLLWFENYLSIRFQRVTVLGVTSSSLQ